MNNLDNPLAVMHELEGIDYRKSNNYSEILFRDKVRTVADFLSITPSSDCNKDLELIKNEIKESNKRLFLIFSELRKKEKELESSEFEILIKNFISKSANEFERTIIRNSYR